MIPLAIPNLSGREEEYLVECVRSGFVSSVGPFVSRLEAMVAEINQTPSAVAVASGTCGLHLALTVAGVRPGELVLIPSFTFIASANAVSHCGASPWLVEIDSESWTMDPLVLRRELEVHTRKQDGQVFHRSTGQRVAAIMPVFTLGHCADMGPLRAVADEYGLPLIADAAAALGAEYRGAPGASLADLTVFSFNGNKTFTCGGGGAITGQRQDWLEQARHLSTTARRGADYDHDAVGFNYRMTNLEAAVGCAQLERLDEFLAAKRRTQRSYNEAFRMLSGVQLFPAAPWNVSACWFSGIVLAGGTPSPLPETIAALHRAGIGARSFWKPVHQQKPYAQCLRSGMPLTEHIWDRVLTLPCSTGITEGELQQTVAAVRAALPCAA